MKLRHFAIVCNEIDQMEKFYKNFGFSDLSNNKEVGKYINTLTGLNDVTLYWKKYINDKNDILELIKYERFNLGKKNYKQKVFKKGFSHVAFTVENINYTVEILVKNGGTLVSDPLMSNDGKVYVCYAYDIEGNLIELVEEINK